MFSTIAGSTINQSGADQILEPTFGTSSLPSTVYIRVQDTDPNNAGSLLDSVLVDQLTLVVGSGILFSEQIREVSKLPRYAVETRAGPWEDVTRDDYLRAVELAEITVQWAKSLVGPESKT